MILGALSLLLRRRKIAVSDADRISCVADGPRALNYLLGRGLKRARAKLWAVLRGVLFLAFGWWMGWSPGAMLAALIYLAILTVALDVLRYTLAKRPIHYCHSRDYRALVLLELCREIETGSRWRRVPLPRPQPMWTLLAALLCTLVVLPAIWLTLESMGVIVRVEIIEQWFLPLTLIFVSAWRVVSTLLEIFVVRGTTPGSLDLFLDSDDAFDTYAGVVLLSWLALIGSNGPLYVALGVLTLRLAYRLWHWWQMRESTALLAAAVRRTHPHASGKVDALDQRNLDSWEDEEDPQDE